MALRWIIAFLLLEWMVAPFVRGSGLGDEGTILLLRLGIFAAFVIGALAVIASRLSRRSES